MNNINGKQSDPVINIKQWNFTILIESNHQSAVPSIYVISRETGKYFSLNIWIQESVTVDQMKNIEAFIQLLIFPMESAVNYNCEKRKISYV